MNSAVSQTNWKQCVWKNEDGRDSGNYLGKTFFLEFFIGLLIQQAEISYSY